MSVKKNVTLKENIAPYIKFVSQITWIQYLKLLLTWLPTALWAQLLNIATYFCKILQNTSAACTMSTGYWPEVWLQFQRAWLQVKIAWLQLQSDRLHFKIAWFDPVPEHLTPGSECLTPVPEHLTPVPEFLTLALFHTLFTIPEIAQNHSTVPTSFTIITCHFFQDLIVHLASHKGGLLSSSSGIDVHQLLVLLSPLLLEYFMWHFSTTIVHLASQLGGLIFPIQVFPLWYQVLPLIWPWGAVFQFYAIFQCF